MAAAAAVDNIHNSIRTLSQTKRIRVTEFFQDFDKLRSGFVTGKDFFVIKVQSNFGRSNSPVSNTRDCSNSFVGPDNFPIHLMLKYTPGSNSVCSNSRTQSTDRRAIFHVKTL